MALVLNGQIMDEAPDILALAARKDDRSHSDGPCGDTSKRSILL